MTTTRIDKRHKDYYVKALNEVGITVDAYNMENTDTCRLFIHSDEAEVLLLVGVLIGRTLAEDSMKNLIP